VNNEKTLLQSANNHVNINVISIADKQLAKRLADHYLALAQVYRQMAGEKPIPTGMQQRKAAANANK
jgi:hypothetical protein